MQGQPRLGLLEIRLVNPYVAAQNDAVLASPEHLEDLGNPVATGAFRVHVGERGLREALV